MALAFPNAPVTGDTYTPQDGNTYRYDGVKWIFATTTPIEPASLKLNDTGIDVTDTGANGNAVILADGATVGYFNSLGLTVVDSLFRLMDSTDHTKIANFQASSISTGTTRTITFPNASGEIVVSTANQTLSNKIFISSGTTITVKDANLTLQDNAVTTKQLNFQLSGITTGITRTLTVPNANGEILIAGDTGTVITISNSTFDNTTIANITSKKFSLRSSINTAREGLFNVSLGSISTLRTYALPDANTTLVADNLPVQTLTLKTLDNAVFTGSTLVNDNIIDKPKLLNHSVQTESLGTLNGTGTTNVNIANATYFTVTMTANARTFAFTNPPPSGHAGTFFMEITNGGLATIDWPLSVRWTQPSFSSVTGTPPLLTPDGVDLLAFTTTDAGSNYRGSFAMKDSK